MNHFAHYIKRIVADKYHQKIADDPLYSELQPIDQGFKAPAYHSVPINSGVASRIAIGDTIWVFSQLSSPWGTLPPSLDGMIVVAEKEKVSNVGRYRFGATVDSKWYSLFDADDLIHKLKAVNAHGKVRPLLNTPRTAIGQALQFLREIHDPSSLLQHAAMVSGMRQDFISYRMVDGTRQAFELAKRLLAKRRTVFWDCWSLPRRLAERNEKVGSEALDSHVVLMIYNSRVVWGVTSKLYAAEGSYSRLEKELATSIGRFRAYPPCKRVQF